MKRGIFGKCFLPGAILLMSVLTLFTSCGGGPAEQKLGDLTLKLSPTTLVVGMNEVDLAITDAAGKAVTDATVTFDVVHLTMAMPKNLVSASHQGGGLYMGTVKVAMAGDWAFFVEVERGDRSLGRVEFNIPAEDKDMGDMDM